MEENHFKADFWARQTTQPLKIKEIIKEQNALSPSDMGKVMGPLMKEFSGTADGKIVQNMVIKELSK